MILRDNSGCFIFFMISKTVEIVVPSLQWVIFFYSLRLLHD